MKVIKLKCGWVGRSAVQPIVLRSTSYCISAVDDHRMLVEPACGATLAAVYSSILPKLQQQGRLPDRLDNIIVVVCGGSAVTYNMLSDFMAVAATK